MQPKMLMAFAAKVHCSKVHGVQQNSHVLFNKVASRMIHGRFLPREPHLAFCFIEHREVAVCLFLPCVEVPLNGSSSTTIWCVKHSSQSYVIRKLVGGASCFIIQVISEVVKQYWLQYAPVACTTTDWPPTGL